MSICADEGHGKTTFALSARKPIHYVTIDVNTEEVIRKEIQEDRLRKRDVTTHFIDMPTSLFGDPDEVKEKADDIWEHQFRPALEGILNDDVEPEAKGSVVLDTATELRDLQLLKFFGRTAQILPEMYTKPNMQWKALVNALKRSGYDVLLLHRLKDVYETRTVRDRNGPKEVREKVEGKREREGFNKTGFLVNAEAFLLFDRARHERIESCFGMRVMRSTQRPALIGEEWWGREKQEDGTRIRRASFPFLMAQLYPGTTYDDWT